MDTKKFTITEDLLASKGTRFLNFVIDVLIIYIIAIGIVSTINIIADITADYELSNWVKSLRFLEQMFFGLLLGFLYYAFTEMYFSRTLAKYFTKTLVVNADGNKPNTKICMIRSVARLNPLDPFSFLGKGARGLHDTLSSTYVVYKHEILESRKDFIA